jgi:hypothetical protein
MRNRFAPASLCVLTKQAAAKILNTDQRGRRGTAALNLSILAAMRPPSRLSRGTYPDDLESSHKHHIRDLGLQYI